jgi:glutamate-1-semialdehyde 2,1-aminomutase
VWRRAGSRLWDVDGNEYVDYAMGFGPHILGHSPPQVVEAVRECLAQGQLYAGQHPAEIEFAELLVDVLPHAERVRIGQSGTEMDQLAVRLARAYTGRQRLVRFGGHYHGWLDPLFVEPGTDPGPDQEPPLTAGQSRAAAGDVILLPWNDLDAVRRTLGPGSDVAAVIMEPILNNTGAIMPLTGYLEGVAELCRDSGTLLVFDEVITGFRVGLGGAQARLGVPADLAVYAKALGSGFPVAALAGRAELLDLTRDVVMHGGTYNTGVSATVAALATVRTLAQDDPYPGIYRTGETLMEGLRTVAEKRGVDLAVEGLGPVFHTRFGPKGGVHDLRTFRERSDGDLGRRFIVALQDEGVRVTPRGTWFVSAAHDDGDIDRTLEAAGRALDSLT